MFAVKGEENELIFWSFIISCILLFVIYRVYYHETIKTTYENPEIVKIERFSDKYVIYQKSGEIIIKEKLIWGNKNNLIMKVELDRSKHIKRTLILKRVKENSK